MLMDGSLFCSQVLGAKRRCKLPRYLTVSACDRVGLPRDPAVAGIQGVIADLDKQFEIFLLREVDVWLSGSGQLLGN